MDATFEVLVPSVLDYARLGFEQNVQRWQGAPSEESGRLFRWGRHLRVERVVGQMRPHVMRRLGAEFHAGSWDYLSITGEGIDMYWSECRGFGVVWNGRSFEDLLRVVLRDVARWAVVFEVADRVEYVVPTDVNGLLQRLHDVLQEGRVPQGLIAYHLGSPTEL